MNCGSSPRVTDAARSRAWRGAVASLAIAAFAALSADALGAAFYKWIDAQGNVHYGDQPPKGFKGEVTRVEVDPAANEVSVQSPAAKAEARGAVKPGPDLLEQRRATRARLEANLASARERLDLAKQALAQFTADGSGQVIQQTFDPSVAPPGTPPGGTPAAGSAPGTLAPPSMGGMLGMSGNRSNCHTNANKTVTCAGLVPNEEHTQHVAALEDAVKRAEADVAEAEVAYRKGVD
jgi:hypothetical protein